MLVLTITKDEGDMLEAMCFDRATQFGRAIDAGKVPTTAISKVHNYIRLANKIKKQLDAQKDKAVPIKRY